MHRRLTLCTSGESQGGFGSSHLANRREQSLRLAEKIVS
jgi:hypothetical protein